MIAEGGADGYRYRVENQEKKEELKGSADIAQGGGGSR